MKPEIESFLKSHPQYDRDSFLAGVKWVTGAGSEPKRLPTFFDEKRTRLFPYLSPIIWDGKEIKNLNLLKGKLQKLYNRTNEGKMPIEEAERYLSRYMDLASKNDFLRNNYTPCGLNSMFNNIMTAYESSKMKTTVINVEFLEGNDKRVAAALEGKGIKITFDIVEKIRTALSKRKADDIVWDILKAQDINLNKILLWS